MCRPPIGVVVDPRQPRVGLQHALRHLVCLVTKHTEDTKVVHDKTGKCHVAGMPTEARAPEVGELVASMDAVYDRCGICST